MRKRPNLPANRGWSAVVSPDIRLHSIGPHGGKLKSRHVLRPGEVAHALVQEHPLGHPGMMPQISARSILARLGVQVHFDQSQIQEMLSGDLPRSVTLTHWGHVPVSLRRGNRTHRVYYPNFSLPVHEREARALIRRGELVLGRDFKWLPSGMLELTPRAVVYEVPLDQISDLAKVNWASGSKRNQLMEKLHRRRKSLRTDLEKLF